MAAPELYRLNSPPLSSLEDPKVNGVLVLQLVILEILDFLGQDWSKNQIDSCAELSYEEYYWFNIGELKQFSVRVKAGHFGKIYGKFAPSHFMEYLKDYSDEMWEARADYFGNKKTELPPVEEVPLTEVEQARQDYFFKSLIKLAERLSAKSSTEISKQDKEKDERMKKHMDFFDKNLTPEQREEIKRRREEIQSAAKVYEMGKE